MIMFCIFLWQLYIQYFMGRMSSSCVLVLLFWYWVKIYYIIYLFFAYVSLYNKGAQCTLKLQYDSKVNVFDRRWSSMYVRELFMSPGIHCIIITCSQVNTFFRHPIHLKLHDTGIHKSYYHLLYNPARILDIPAPAHKKWFNSIHVFSKMS